MIAFTVHEPPTPPADRIDRAERLEFIRDGFAPLAAAIPPLWMAMNKLWMVLLLYLLAFMGVSLILSSLGVAPASIALINLAANVIIGFEADNLKRWTFARRGWAEVGTVVGKNRAECERRFFDGWLVQQPTLRTVGGPVGSDAVTSRLRMPNLLSAKPPVQPGTGAQMPPRASTVFGDETSAAAARPANVAARPLWQRLFQR
jgi:hypothetical protein